MFFQDIDGMRILEMNSSRVEGMELHHARKLFKLYKQARKEIVNKLLSTPTNTFTEARLESALRQIQEMLIVLNEKINPELKFGFDSIHEQGVEDSAKEMNAFEKHFNGVIGAVPVDAIIESTNPDNFLFNQFSSSIATYNSNLRQQFQRILGQSLIQQRTWSQAVFDMEQVFNTEEWVLARIVRTELHNIYNISKLKGFNNIKQDYLPDLKKTLYHPMDSRTGDDSKVAAAKNLIVDLDEPFVYTFKQGNKTITRRFMAPPERPNDRAILIPYRESYNGK